MRTRTCRSRRWSRVCRLLLLLLCCPRPYRGEMELPALAPPAPQPRVRIGIDRFGLSLSSDSGAGAVHGLAPPPARVAA
ncbi:hypothetical protein B0H14DRAFT_2744092, partial [Mycena olivaceomarginata]